MSFKYINHNGHEVSTKIIHFHNDMTMNLDDTKYEPIPKEIEQKGKIILDSAFNVHKGLGPGLLESVYEACLVYEIRQRGLQAACQVELPVVYAGVRIESGLRLDILVEKRIIVEVKAVETMNKLYEAQLLTYMKLAGVRLGFLINFNTILLKNGIHRMVL